MKHLKLIGIVVGCSTCLFALALAVAIHFIQGSVGSALPNLPPTPSLLSTTDTITIWMSLLGVLVALAALVVTAAGLSIAVFAILGWQRFEDVLASTLKKADEETKILATSTAKEEAQRYLQTTEFETSVTARLREIGSVIQWTADTVTNEKSFPNSEEESEIKSLAKEYPRSKPCL